MGDRRFRPGRRGCLPDEDAPRLGHQPDPSDHETLVRCADSRPRLMLLWFSRPWQDLGVVGLQVRYQPASHAHDDRYSVGANDAEQAAANRSRLSVRDSSLLKSHAAFKNRSAEAALRSWQVKSAARGFVKHVDVLDAKVRERSMAAAREEWGIPPPARL